MELKSYKNLVIDRNECILKIDKASVKYKGWLFNGDNSVFEGIIEVLNPRFAFVDLVEDKWRFFKKVKIINSKKIKNSIARINYFRNDVVGQIRLMEIIDTRDALIKRIHHGVKFAIDLRFDDKENKEILERIKEIERSIKIYWSIKRYKVLRKEINEDEIIYKLWDGLEDRIINISYRDDKLQLAKFYDLKTKVVNELLVSEE